MCVLAVKSALLKYEGSLGYNRGSMCTRVQEGKCTVTYKPPHTHDSSLMYYMAYYWALCAPLSCATALYTPPVHIKTLSWKRAMALLTFPVVETK